MPVKIIFSFAHVENFRRTILEVVCDVCVVKMCNLFSLIATGPQTKAQGSQF
jgi:hypothetical protein